MTNLTLPVKDFPEKMLSRGQPCTIDALLTFSRDEPLADLEDRDVKWMTRREHAKWWKRAAALRIQYPGFQEAHWYRERMKYGNLPGPGAPLSEFVRARVSHAKVLWSRDISAGRAQSQFREWLRLHVDGQTWMPPVWPDQPGWAEALQVLRIACELRSFDPTITWDLRPAPKRKKGADDE